MASLASETGISQPATLRIRALSSSPQAALPPQIDRAEIPKTKAFGLLSMTRSTAPSSAASISSIDLSKSALLLIAMSGMTMRPR